MRKRLLGLLVLTLWSTSGACADPLGGLWALDSLCEKGRVSRDPRWKCTLQFEPTTGRFKLLSSTVTEKWLLAKDGTSSTQPIVSEWHLAGSYQWQEPVLRLQLQQPVSAEQSQYAHRYFGAPGADGCYRPVVTIKDQLVLQIPERQLIFTRQSNKKT